MKISDYLGKTVYLKNEKKPQSTFFLDRTLYRVVDVNLALGAKPIGITKYTQKTTPDFFVSREEIELI